MRVYTVFNAKQRLKDCLQAKQNQTYIFGLFMHVYCSIQRKTKFKSNVEILLTSKTKIDLHVWNLYAYLLQYFMENKV